MGLTVFDIDGVLVSFTREIFVPCANNVLGTSIDPNYIPTCWSYSSIIPNPEDEAQVWSSPLLVDYIRAAKVLPHALQLIRNTGESAFITSRGAEGNLNVQSATWEFLVGLGFRNKSCFFVHGHEKAPLALKLRATQAWEDHPDTALAYAEAGITCFMPDYGYNREANHPNIIRVMDWDR